VATTLGALGNNAGWVMTFVFKTASVPGTTVGYYIGAVDSLTAVPANWFGMRSDTNNSDGAFYKLCVNATCDATTYASDATGFHKLRIRSTTAAKLLMKFDNNTERSFCSASCDVTVAPTTNALTAGWTTITRAAAARNLQVDYFAFKATGLSR
jgi:hypothetical protein